MKVKRVNTSALLILPSLTVLAASLQAADINPVWVEYAPTTNSPTRDTPVAAPAVAAPALAPAAASSTPVVAAPVTPASTAASADTPVAAKPAAAPTAVAPAVLVPAAASSTPAVTAPVAQASGAVPAISNPQTGPAVLVATDASPASPDGKGMVTTASITPRLFAFDYVKNSNESLPQYLERYDYRDGMAGDNRSGTYVDLDLSLNMNNGDRDVFVLERRGFGLDNHRGMARFDDDEITLSGSYSHYRSSTGGIDYLYSPAVVPGAGTAPYPGPDYFTGNLPFLNNTGTSDYHIDRTSYAAGLRMKPGLLGGSVALDFDYEGYQRQGNQLGTTVVMVGLGGPPTIDSWRGINLAIDERMNKFSFTISASPENRFNVAYDVSMEQFTNQAPDLTRNDIMGTSGTSRQALSPFYYVPDTSLFSQNIRLSKNFDNNAVLAAGIGHSTLEDESTAERFTATFGGSGGPDYWEGQISTSTAYLTGNANVSETVSVEGHIKYYDRDNKSSFPVPHVIAPSGANARMAGPRINSIESMDYGLAANWRPGTMSSNLTLGWQRLDIERDLTYGAYSEAIPANRILYREDTLSDEVYLKWIATPSPGVTLRVNPSYLWADKTGLVTEPEEAAKLNIMVSYAAPEGWLLSGFYDYKNKKNSDLYVTGDTLGAGTQYNQDLDSTLNTLGATLNMMPREDVNTSISLYWMQNDLENYFLSTDLTRQFLNDPVVYTNNGLTNYVVDSYVFTLAADWQTNEKLKLSGSYTYTQNKGDTASGDVLLALQTATGTIDSRIDNTLHSLALGADYTLSPETKLHASYFYDYYDDSTYDLLTGGVNTLTIGLSYQLK